MACAYVIKLTYHVLLLECFPLMPWQLKVNTCQHFLQQGKLELSTSNQHLPKLEKPMCIYLPDVYKMNYIALADDSVSRWRSIAEGFSFP